MKVVLVAAAKNTNIVAADKSLLQYIKYTKGYLKCFR